MTSRTTASAITLLTDFGTADGYVGEMKGVLTSLAPGAPIIDITHDIPAQDVESARLALARYWRRFPPGTVHVVVVDPGVGSARLPIAVTSGEHFFCGPDNGVLSPALFALDARAVSLAVPSAASPTFHGRDVFAPAAAQLAMGVALEDIGEPFGEPVRLRTPSPSRLADGAVEGVVLTVDRFGNAITNLIARNGAVIQVGAHRLPLSRTYSDVPTGTLLALVGSNGLVEIAMRDGNAATALGLSRGAPVLLR